MTYAFTGCSGEIPPDVSATLTWGTLPDLGGSSLTAPVMHGILQLAPKDWRGALVATSRRAPPAYSGGGNPANEVVITDLTEARTLPYWRDPVLRSGSPFGGATSGGLSDPVYGYCARWGTTVEICGLFATRRAALYDAVWGNGVHETRVIAGRPAVVRYSPPGEDHNPYVGVIVVVYDAPTESLYQVRGLSGGLRGDNVDAVIAIAESLFGGDGSR